MWCCWKNQRQVCTGCHQQASDRRLFSSTALFDVFTGLLFSSNSSRVSYWGQAESHTAFLSSFGPPAWIPFPWHNLWPVKQRQLPWPHGGAALHVQVPWYQSLVCSTQAVAAIKPYISTLHSTECWRAPCSQSQEWSWASLPFSPANLHLPWWSDCPVLHPHNTSDVSMDASPPQLQFPPISQSLLHSTLPNTRQAASRIRE